ncbi:MAG: hypothetical protein ABI266_05760 [Ginsengibacter sp.]
MWFFSASNPTLTFGGFDGECKEEMYLQLPEIYYPNTLYIEKGRNAAQEILNVAKNGFNYPFIVKPEIGTSGLMVRGIWNESQYKDYHNLIPVNYMVQEFISYPLEVCIFYHRHPTDKKGKISGFISKQLPVLTGDGISTIKELLQKYQELNLYTSDVRKELFSSEEILKPGEILNLTVIGNRSHGATFSDLAEHIDDRLLDVFDAISHSTKFYYGRYDIMCRSVEDFKKGDHFVILEFNGAGAIPNHVFAGNYTLWQAYKEIVRHWKILHEISSYNHRMGIYYWPFMDGYRFLGKAKNHYKTLRKCDSMLSY